MLLPRVHAQRVKHCLSVICPSSAQKLLDLKIQVSQWSLSSIKINSRKLRKTISFLLLNARHSPQVLQIMQLHLPRLSTTPSKTMCWSDCTHSTYRRFFFYVSVWFIERIIAWKIFDFDSSEILRCTQGSVLHSKRVDFYHSGLSQCIPVVLQMIFGISLK